MASHTAEFSRGALDRAKRRFPRRSSADAQLQTKQKTPELALEPSDGSNSLTANRHSTSSESIERTAFDCERLLNAQFAERLGVSERYIRDHTTRRSPRIPAVRLGELIGYRRSDVELFMSELI